MQALKLSMMELDEATVSVLVSLHAHLIFNHRSHYLHNHGKTFLKNHVYEYNPIGSISALFPLNDINNTMDMNTNKKKASKMKKNKKGNNQKQQQQSKKLTSKYQYLLKSSNRNNMSHNSISYLLNTSNNNDYSYSNIESSKFSLLIAKSVGLSLRSYIAPNLDEQLSGGSLFLLTSMIQSIHNNSSTSHSSTNNRNSKSSSESGLHSIDRDLLFLLQSSNPAMGTNNNTNEDALQYKPLNFHIDSLPWELVKATTPLAAIYNRSAELLVQYPGNEMLIQVCKLSVLISNFHITTPLGKVIILLYYSNCIYP